MSEGVSSIRLFGTAEDSIVDGPGLRYSIFVQGCSHHCPGCHNFESQDKEGGYVSSIDELLDEIEANQIIQGVTLSGGEPLEQSEACYALARALKMRQCNIWLYTGYLFEDILKEKPDKTALDLLKLCDVVVDGPFVEKLHSHELQWRGSANQRVIDVQKSLVQAEVVLWESHDCYPEVPSSW